MNWTEFLPRQVLPTGPALLGHTLAQSNPDFPDYLRKLGLAEVYQSIISTGQTVFTPTIAEPKFLVPVIANAVVARADYIVGATTFTFNTTVVSGVEVRFYTTEQLFYTNAGTALSSRQLKLDYYGSKYKDIRNTIKTKCPRYKLLSITVRYDSAPDLVAYDEYKDVNLWWAIMLYNGFIFPEQLQTGITIKVPDQTQLIAWQSALSKSNSPFRNETAAKVRV